MNTLADTGHAGFLTALSETQLQNVLKNYFPLREYAANARISLLKPKVQLTSKNKEIVLLIPLEAKVTGGKKYPGHAKFLVGLSYKSTSGNLYLDKPRLQELVFPDIENNVLAELETIVDTLVQNSLPLVHLLTVSEKDLNHTLERSLLKNADITHGRLNLEFGFH